MFLEKIREEIHKRQNSKPVESKDDQEARQVLESVQSFNLVEPDLDENQAVDGEVNRVVEEERCDPVCDLVNPADVLQKFRPAFPLLDVKGDKNRWPVGRECEEEQENRENHRRRAPVFATGTSLAGCLVHISQEVWLVDY